MKGKFARRAALVSVAAALLGTIAAAPAQAYGTVTWWMGCASYRGDSWWSDGAMLSYSRTTANDNDEVAAAVRYYQGSTAYTHGYGYALRTRATLSYGGYHQSYCFPGTQTRSS